MKRLLETLYVLTPESYVFHRNENICVSVGGEEKVSIPALQIDSMVIFGQNTVSTSLLGFCAGHGISLAFLSRSGSFYGRVAGPVCGNVLLRKRQYAAMGEEQFACAFVRNVLFAKIRNAKTVLLRAARNADDARAARLYDAASHLGGMALQLDGCTGVDSMRGIEGAAASAYFARFDDMLLAGCGYRFVTRSRRPPQNEVNAVLSFLYTLLAHDASAALETVGLDPAAGFLHTLRPGRPSLALDLMEELRAPLCDRLTLSLLNKNQLDDRHFERESHAVFLSEKGRRAVLGQWRNRRQEEILHPFLKEKIPIGLIPYAQALLLARVLRGDLDQYPPFVWR